MSVLQKLNTLFRANARGAAEIAAAENQQHQLEIQLAELILRVKELEITLRQLIAEIRQHRGDVKMLGSQAKSVGLWKCRRYRHTQRPTTGPAAADSGLGNLKFPVPA